MSSNPQYEQQMFRENIASLFTPISYDESSRMFYTSDSFIGFGWISNPTTGASDTTADKLNMLLSMQFPPGTLMSFTMFASPDIDTYIANLLNVRVKANFGNHPVLEQAIREKAEFLIGGTKKRLNDRVYGILRDVVVLVTVKVPAAKGALPTDKDWRTAAELRTGLEKGLEGLGLAPTPLDQHLYLHIMGSMINWGKNASWRNGDPHYDPKNLLNQQVVDFDTDIKIVETLSQMRRSKHYIEPPLDHPQA